MREPKQQGTLMMEASFSSSLVTVFEVHLEDRAESEKRKYIYSGRSFYDSI